MSDTEPLQPIDVTAATLEQAIEEGLDRLSLSRNDVIIEIVEEGSRGVLGMGAREAVVRLTPLRAPNPPAGAQPPAPVVREVPEVAPPPEPALPDAPAPSASEPESPVFAPEPRAPLVSTLESEQVVQVATGALKELLEHMDIEADVEANLAKPASASEEVPWVLNIHGTDLGILIGRRGETLNALQYITRLIVSRELQRRANIVIDVEGYKSRRESALRKLALRMAEQARRLGRTVTLEPMPPNERRIIHITLREDNTVTTESVGAGNQRKVTIIPTHDSGR